MTALQGRHGGTVLESTVESTLRGLEGAGIAHIAAHGHVHPENPLFSRLVQGYLAVTALYLNATNGNDIGGGQPTLTGPSIVDQSNIEQILPYAQNNTR